MDIEDIELVESTEESLTKEAQKRSYLWWLLAVLLLLVISIALTITTFLHLNAAPKHDLPTSFTVESGTNVKTITANLEKQGLVKSETFLYLLLVTFFEPTNIKASTYIIEEPFTAFQLAKKLVEGDFDSDLIRFTHFEGETVNHIANNAEKQLSGFDKDAFLQLSLPLEGRLFPDTYFIPQTFSATELNELLLTSFEEAIEPLQDQILASKFSLEEILVLASIIEREANTASSMNLVSSVLQNRLAIGMPLQADASIEYVLNKPLKELTPKDLEIDSPYNTYLNPGLPPTPIGNPGLDSIIAVLEPTESNYFYYITDDSGKFHFSETYDQHLQNINIYLR